MDGDSEYVLVIGSAGIDLKGKPDDVLVVNAPNIGQIRNSVGGVARNIAENLARLEIETVLLSAVSDDEIGQRVINKSTSAGIDCTHVLRVNGARIASNLSIIDPHGNTNISISDYEITNYLDSDYLIEHESLFADASLIVIDATLSRETLDTLFELVARYKIRVCADPTSPVLAGRLCQYINQLFLIVPNASETTALCGIEQPATDHDSAINTARNLVTMGATIAVVTLGELGLAYADQNGSGFIRAIDTHVVDSTGAGDAFSGAVIFGLLNDVPVDEAMRLGVTAASLTLQSRETVLPSLSQELLYDELLV